MKRLNALLALALVIWFALACSGIFTKLNAEKKKEAEKVAKVGKYKVLQIKKDNPHNTAACECASKYAIIVDPVEERADQQNLCIGAGHSDLDNYAALNKGDVVTFEVSDTLLDLDCSESPASFLRIKK
jgi:hypothetical protein